MMENLQSINSRPIAEAVPSRHEGKSEKSSLPQSPGDTLDLSAEAKAQLRKLKQRDAEVRAHERAHMAAAGGNAVGGPHYECQKGPDGKQYAIGGHVDISISSVDGNPDESEKNAREARRAALAPGQPSSQDRAVAAQAANMEARAKTEKLEEQKEEKTEDGFPDLPQKSLETGISENNFSNSAEGDSPFVQEHDRALMRKAIGVYNEVALAGTMDAGLINDNSGLLIAV